MPATANVGAGKTLIVQQTASEQAAYTIAASNVFAAGFSIDEIIVDTQVTAGAGATLAITNNGNTVLAAATAGTAAVGAVVAALTATTANLAVAPGTNLVLTTAGANSQSRITLVVSELASRTVTVS